LLKKKEEELRRLLCRYKYWHEMCFEAFPLLNEWRYLCATDLVCVDEKMLSESTAVSRLVNLPPAWWGRIRTCICGQWFHAKFSNQQFCSEACRLKEYATSNKWREYRRKKSLEYYHLHKNANVK
jgi:hypothetical protein